MRAGDCFAAVSGVVWAHSWLDMFVPTTEGSWQIQPAADAWHPDPDSCEEFGYELCMVCPSLPAAPVASRVPWRRFTPSGTAGVSLHILEPDEGAGVLAAQVFDVESG